MQKYFECKLRYDKQITDPEDKDCGKIKTVNETYLTEALSYTEAEARIAMELGKYIQGEYDITGIKRVRYAELFYKDEDLVENWYACKMKITVLDESRGMERKVNQTVLVRAGGVDDAFNRLNEGMKGTMSDYEIYSIALSPVLDFFKYEPSSNNNDKTGEE